MLREIPARKGMKTSHKLLPVMQIACILTVSLYTSYPSGDQI